MEKKRPAPEGTGLPGVVSSDIVNWEGNYILDTNTFLIVIMSPFPLALFFALALLHGQELERVLRSCPCPHLEVQMGTGRPARVAD